ncbi:MAG: type IV secretion system protein [Sphingomonas sp.]|nr:type IV secretion system protein [Sphingomonas sp.]
MMQSFCNPSAADRFAARLLADTDCQANGLVERGYAALAQPGGTGSIALTGLMVIAVAFFGYRLLLGRGLALRDAVVLTVKLGIVLMLASSWESWQALAYNGLARAPTQIAGDVLTGIGAADPIESLQRMLDGLAQAAVGYRMRAGIASPLVGGPPAAAAVLNLSSVFLTLSIVGILVAARVVLAVLLAIAPAMAGLMLFTGTRGMVQGWLGAIAAAAIAPLFVLVLAAVEFAIMDPMLGRLLTEQAAGRYEDGAVMPLGLVTVVFMIATAFALRSGAQIARGIRLPSMVGNGAVAQEPAAGVGQDRFRVENTAVSASTQSVTRALESMARRETPPSGSAQVSSRGLTRSRDGRAAPGTANIGSASLASIPGRASARRAQPIPRHSRSVRRRDA